MFQKLLKSVFIRNILLVMSGTAIAQIIGFSLTPLISRLYSPSDFGILGSFNSVTGIIAAGVTLEYTQAIMLPKDKATALNVFAISLLATVFVSFLCLLFCIIAPSIPNKLMHTRGVWALALLVLAVFGTGFNVSCQAWCVRSKAFKHTSTSQVIRSLSSNGSQIGFGYLKSGSLGLIFSNVMADLLASINLALIVIPDIRNFRMKINLKKILHLAKEYRDFPMYAASQNIINALSTGLPVLLLTHYYGIATAGAYAFGVRMLQIPMGFVLRPLRQVLFQKASESQHIGGKLSVLYIKITTGLFALTIVPSIIVFIWAPDIFSWVFGSKWFSAGEFARSLIIWMVFAFCNLPATLFARIIRIQKNIFIYDLVLLTARTSILVIGGIFLTALHTVMLFAIIGAIMNAILILWVGKVVLKKDKEPSPFCITDNLQAN